ncbi:MAG: hypothetical protein VB081_06335 [Christensenella sp.]|uniref:hypothetical protein n=1 Tax=Christensenella sp. TaxID=1935934 RepID=UPI002B207B55|nr:hypothetical protein [Christensenella sp.]MEA5003099.1 hypothetical protein [Christensenella sp.]
MQTVLPVGLRRDGSYYTRIVWASHTESDPTFWVCNVITDDNARGGGTWGTNTTGPANLVLDFWGETQSISKIDFFRNVGLDISILEELAKNINIYVTNDDAGSKLRRKDDDIDSVDWKLAGSVETQKAEGWEQVMLEKPVEARFVRIELVDNHGTPPDIPWTEINQVKLYP